MTGIEIAIYPELARDARELTRQGVEYGMIEQYNRGVRAAMDAIGPHALARLPDGARKRLSMLLRDPCDAFLSGAASYAAACGPWFASVSDPHTVPGSDQ